MFGSFAFAVFPIEKFEPVDPSGEVSLGFSEVAKLRGLRRLVLADLMAGAKKVLPDIPEESIVDEIRFENVPSFGGDELVSSEDEELGRPCIV
jgi:hypothetical protein